MISLRRFVLPAAYVIGAAYCVVSIVRAGMEVGLW